MKDWMNILYQFNNQCNLELHNKSPYVKELTQSITKINQILKQHNTIHWSHKIWRSSSENYNKQLLQLIKIISEPQAEAIYLVKKNNRTTQKQSNNEHSRNCNLSQERMLYKCSFIQQCYYEPVTVLIRLITQSVN